MPKIKTHKGLAKRVKVTKNGKLKRMKAFRSHLMSTKNGKRVRHLRKGDVISPEEARKMKRMLGIG